MQSTTSGKGVFMHFYYKASGKSVILVARNYSAVVTQSRVFNYMIKVSSFSCISEALVIAH